MNETILKIIRSFTPKFTNAKVFSTPEIPPKKLKNAIKAYAPDVSENDVFFLMDTTLFGSGKNGLLLTEDTLFVHYTKPKKIAVRDIQNITLEESDVEVYESIDIHINDPESEAIADINEKDARLFAQMLKEIRAALTATGAGSTGGELVIEEITRTAKETARISSIQRKRIVPFEGGKLRRYRFENLTWVGDKLTKVENPRAGLFNHPKVWLERKEYKVYAIAEGKDVFINGHPLAGKCELADRDMIGLGSGTDRIDYQYQDNAVIAKKLRKVEEQARGIIRYAEGQTPGKIVCSKFVIDPMGINLSDDLGGNKISWADVDEVVFYADYDSLYKATTNLGNAAGQGLALGAQTATSTLESQRLSDLKAVFPAPLYKVEFLSSGTAIEKIEKVDQNTCTLLDHGIELFAPMDLVKFK